MSVDLKMLDNLLDELKPFSAKLVAVSKTKPLADLLTVYNHSHRFFGENYVQELLSKKPLMPVETEWHFIGHLQSNKVRLITPFVHLIHGVDNVKLAREINVQALKLGKVQDILLQIHIAREDTKFGFDGNEVLNFVHSIQKEDLPGIRLKGCMGMATFTDSHDQIRSEFKILRNIFETVKSNLELNQRNDFTVLSMGMSSDYKIALDEGSNLVRIGSAIFGNR